jgi:hypothetical protein
MADVRAATGSVDATATCAGGCSVCSVAAAPLLDDPRPKRLWCGDSVDFFPKDSLGVPVVAAPSAFFAPNCTGVVAPVFAPKAAGAFFDAVVVGSDTSSLVVSLLGVGVPNFFGVAPPSFFPKDMGGFDGVPPESSLPFDLDPKADLVCPNADAFPDPSPILNIGGFFGLASSVDVSSALVSGILMVGLNPDALTAGLVVGTISGDFLTVGEFSVDFKPKAILSTAAAGLSSLSVDVEAASIFFPNDILPAGAGFFAPSSPSAFLPKEKLAAGFFAPSASETLAFAPNEIALAPAAGFFPKSDVFLMVPLEAGSAPGLVSPHAPHAI